MTENFGLDLVDSAKENPHTNFPRKTVSISTEMIFK